MTEPSAETSAEEFLVEGPRLFSESHIWELQRRYYELHGIKAWAEGRIPFSISTSPHIAGAYARVVFGFLRDWLPELDLSEPVYIVEIGAGSGRLGFNFLKQLTEFYDDSALKDVPFRYVLTDLVLKNVEFWEAHPALKPFVDAGRLDFAQFDAVTDSQMVLRHSGKTLKAGDLRNPIIVLANYVLDTIPQDLFSVEGNQLYAVTTALASSQPEPDVMDPAVIGRIEIVYDRFPVDEHFYGDKHSASILRMYRESLESTMLTFPQLALRCIDAIRTFADGRMMLLSADKGDHRLEGLDSLEIPPIMLHDEGFSIPFNYHALAQYFENLGGTVLTTSFHYVSLNILGCLLGSPATMAETTRAFRDFIDYNSPDDNFTGMLRFDRRDDAALVEHLAYMRMKRHDTHAFLLIYPQLTKRLGQVPLPLVLELRRMVHRVWDYYYEMDERHDVAFYLGVVLSAIEDFPGSVPFFQYSIDRHDNPTARFNLAISYNHMNEHRKALDALDGLPAERKEHQEVIDLKVKIAAGAAAANPEVG